MASNYLLIRADGQKSLETSVSDTTPQGPDAVTTLSKGPVLPRARSLGKWELNVSRLNSGHTYPSRPDPLRSFLIAFSLNPQASPTPLSQAPLSATRAGEGEGQESPTVASRG